VLIGRGINLIFELAKEKLFELNVQSFDEAAPYLPHVMKESLELYFLKECGGRIPEGHTLESMIETFRARNDFCWRSAAVDAFLVGYSFKNNCPGVATISSYRGYDLQEVYDPNFLYFFKPEIVKKYAMELGHRPQSKAEMSEALRRVYQEEKKENRPDFIVGGGNIDCTIIKKDGSIEVEELGPLEVKKLTLLKNQ
jgi:hypothetical protein